MTPNISRLYPVDDLSSPESTIRSLNMSWWNCVGHLNESKDLILAISSSFYILFPAAKDPVHKLGERFFCKMFTIYECWIISYMNSQVMKVWCRLRGDVQISRRNETDNTNGFIKENGINDEEAKKRKFAERPKTVHGPNHFCWCVLRTAEKLWKQE